MKNFKFIKENKGLTLVELLISISIVVTSATIVVAIITASFRGASKTNTSEDLRTYGNTAMTQMAKIIQFADNFESGVIDDENIEGEVEYVCNTESSIYSEINIENDGVNEKLSCYEDASGNIDLRINDQSVLDLKKVKINDCYFTCSQKSDNNSPFIGISFEIQSVNNLEDQTGSIEFKKNVKIRNSNQ